jgi:glycosyltransferase involved in cell wall biosynthesis
LDRWQHLILWSLDTKSMQILFLLTQDMESPAGAGRYFPLARGLVKLGHKVRIAALHANFNSLRETCFNHKGVEIYYVAQMHVLKQGNHKLYYPPHRLLALMMRATWALSRAALSLPADIVHIGKPHPMNSIAGLLARHLRGKKIFLDCDDLEIATSHFSGRWQKWGVALFENGMPKRVHHVTTHTYYLRDRLLGLGIPEELITYLPNGVDTERFTCPNPDELDLLRNDLGLQGKKVVAFIGSLSLPSHPVDLLLEAYQKVHKAVPESKLLIVGGGEEFDRLNERVQELGLRESTIFTGRIPAARAPLYYQLADVIVDPVIDNEVGRTRLPLKMFESWASQVPFVTADVGDRKIVIGDPPAGLLAIPGQACSLALMILRVLENENLAQQLRESGTERINQYAWDKLAQDLEVSYLFHGEAPPRYKT